MGGATGGTAEQTAAVNTLANTPAVAAAVPQWAAAQTPAPAVTPAPVTAPAVTPNLGFPTVAAREVASPMAPAVFNHTPYTKPSDVPHIGAPDPVAPAAAAGTTDPTKPDTSPMDWLYPGNLPMHFDTRASVAPTSGVGAGAGGTFGMPWAYSATGPNYTAGYGSVGGFGGVTGYGPAQEGLADQKLLPEMKAGTQLTGAQIDQYNRVRREDYDRYMKLYGVGYDLPAYQQGLNRLVYEQNMAGQVGSSGG